MNESVIALFIEGTYPWYRGGVSEWVFQYIKAFPDYRFRIVQVATDEYRNTSLSEALYRVPEHIVSFDRVPPPENVIFNSEQTRSWVDDAGSLIKDTCGDADIIHIANTGFAGLLGLAAADRHAKPLVLTEHALYWLEVEMGAVALECGYKVPDNADRKKEMVRLFRDIAEKIYADADTIISVSKYNVSLQKEMGAAGVRYIPNGVEKRWLQPGKERNAPPVIGWIGRCAEMKNPLRFFDVIDAFRASDKLSPRFVMMICDAGEDSLQQMVCNRAEGYPELQLVVNQAAEKFLPGMDALCITSHNESQPLVLFEALAKKVLPIGWQTGDVTDEFGMILSSGSGTDDLVQRFTALWNQPQAWSNEINNRFEMVKENHTWDRIFNRYRKLFEPYLTKETVYE